MPTGMGAQEGNRTLDLLITSEMLCRLSYLGVEGKRYPTIPGAGKAVAGPGGVRSNDQFREGRRSASATSWSSSLALKVKRSANSVIASSAASSGSGSDDTSSSSR
jgi:hypothetical protein